MAEHGAKPDLSGADLHIAVVVSREEDDVARRLLRGALGVFEEHGVEDPDIFWVADALAMPVTALALAEKGGHDAIVCLGCVIRGETFRFEVIANQTAQGLMQVQLDTGVPIALGLLTTQDRDQAQARYGPMHNKATNDAEPANEMDNLQWKTQ